jgi:endonuclease IV
MSIGYHVGKTDHKGKKCEYSKVLKDFIDDMNGYGFHDICAQIFVSGPQTLNKPTVPESDYADIRELTSRGLKLIAHAAYVSNPWKMSPGAIHNVREELRICDKIGALGLVVHLSAAAFEYDTLKYVLEKISKNLDIERPLTLWLEINAAKRSDFTYETPDKIKALFEKINKIETEVDLGKLSISLCVDSAHLFSIGVSLADYSMTEKWLNDLQDIPNLMFHLNDSKSELGSGVDRHEALLKGKIWSEYHPVTGRLGIESSGLLAILNFATENNSIAILERGEGLCGDLMLIQTLGYFQD